MPDHLWLYRWEQVKSKDEKGHKWARSLWTPTATNETAALSLALLHDPLLDSPGTWRAGRLNMKLNCFFFFLMKEIRVVQVNLVGLDDSSQHIEKDYTVRVSEFHWLERISLLKYPRSCIHIHQKEREERENESPFKLSSASAKATRKKAGLSPFWTQAVLSLVCSGLITRCRSQLPTPPGDPLAALPGVCPGPRSFPNTDFQVRMGRSRKQRAHCLAQRKVTQGGKATKTPTPFLILSRRKKGENKLTQPWHLLHYREPRNPIQSLAFSFSINQPDWSMN